jgi:HlyD family secretion protein
MKRKTLYWIIGSSLGAVALLLVLSKAGVLGDRKTLRVATEAVGSRDIVETVSASGKIYPVSEVKISPDVSGEITELLVQEGDSVRKGQMLASINSIIYQSMVTRANAQLNQTRSSVSNASAMMKQAKAQLDQATATFERNRSLYLEKVISAVEFETAEASYKAAKATYEAALESIRGNRYGVESAQASANEARQSLQRTTLYSPMNGIVSKLFVKKGERVVGTAQMAGTEIMRVADMSKMKVDVEVGENDIQKVKLGDTARIEVEAYSAQMFQGIVTQISQSSTATGMQQSLSALTDQVTNYTVSIEIITESYAELQKKLSGRFPFRPGMSASVEIMTNRQSQVTAVPINAVTTREPEEDNGEKNTAGSAVNDDRIREYVFVVNKENKTELREVKTGVQDNEHIEILEGLQKGEAVVVAPFSAIARTLKKDMKVKVVPKKELFDKQKDEEKD